MCDTIIGACLKRLATASEQQGSSEGSLECESDAVRALNGAGRR